ncbi:MAG: hypothetical protein PUB49_00560 [Selenomonadaceae bacterium]|nr:hypothetical protein [Selenomonadaceae bacterium]
MTIASGGSFSFLFQWRLQARVVVGRSLSQLLSSQAIYSLPSLESFCTGQSGQGVMR